MVGTGLIGSTLLKQIENSQLPIRICGLANSKVAYFDNNGITIQKWHEKLINSKSNIIEKFVKQMIKLDLSNSIFVDCTASEEVVAKYASILKAGIAIVTSNKQANSSSFDLHKKLHTLAREYNTSFIYETNVGAGLPIIYVIQNIINGGDDVIKIEGVLSGTLSYIFNFFSLDNKKFSEIVREAKTKGITEPDPRDDLSGKDVAKKTLILAREIGLELELKQIEVQPILPVKFFSINSVNDFFFELEKLDSDFDILKKQISKQNKVLRYIATIENGKAQVKLRKIDKNHPFYHLSGSDNIVSISTKRYNTPIVIKACRYAR